MKNPLNDYILILLCFFLISVRTSLQMLIELLLVVGSLALFPLFYYLSYPCRAVCKRRHPLQQVRFFLLFLSNYCDMSRVYRVSTSFPAEYLHYALQWVILLFFFFIVIIPVSFFQIHISFSFPDSILHWYIASCTWWNYSSISIPFVARRSASLPFHHCSRLQWGKTYFTNARDFLLLSS